MLLYIYLFVTFTALRDKQTNKMLANETPKVFRYKNIMIWIPTFSVYIFSGVIYKYNSTESLDAIFNISHSNSWAFGW